MSDDFNFDDLSPQEKPFTYAGKSYLVREAPEAAVYAWKNANAKLVIRNQQGEFVGVTGGAELESQLVAACVFERADKGEKAVPVEAVRGWPSRLVQGLYRWVREASGLAAEAEDQAALEKQFGDLVEKLASLASDGGQKRQWSDWMVTVVQDRLARAQGKGSLEEQEKNGVARTAATSSSASG